jgi:hypothetical protein
MEATKSIKLLIILTGFAALALATPRSQAQSEVDPDHFDSPNTRPFLQSKTKMDSGSATAKVHFSGNVNLPYSVRCAGKGLPPGNYSLSISSDGKTGVATLNRKSQTFEIPGAIRLPADPHARSALLVERIGKIHRLAAIHVKEMELVFDSDLHVEYRSDVKPRRTEELLLTQTSAAK